MKRIISAALLLVVLATSSWAGFEEDMAVYMRGDHTTSAACTPTTADQRKPVDPNKTKRAY